MPSLSALALATAAILSAVAPAHAQSVADFYRGKTVNMLCGIGAGGEFDLLARLVAKHIVRHIPGNPTAVAQNMIGASGMKMLNYLYSQAPQDGTFMGIVQTGLPAAQAVGLKGIEFDAAKFNWLGSMAPAVETIVLWHTTGAKTVDDARKREIVIGATSKGSNTHNFPALMNEFFGTKFKIVTGYTGGNQINLAMERGEVEGRTNSWASWKATKPQWLKENKINVIVQAGPGAPDLDAPSVEAMAKTPEDRQVIELILSGSHLGRPFAITPGVPEERVKALRAAFDAVMKDAAFLAEAAALNFEVAPISGAALQKTAERIVGTPKDVAARARHLLE